MYSRKFLLFSDTDVWIKKDGDKDFNINMGSFDATEICQVVGLYFLYKLGEKCGKERIGLYKDNGLACFENTRGLEAEKLIKHSLNYLRMNSELTLSVKPILRLSIF